MNEEAQAIFGYIMMPVFVITLLNQFIYQPMVKDLGDLWEDKNITKFRDCILRQCLIVLGLTVAIIIGGVLVGLPILSMMYNINLTSYTTEFALLLAGGSLYALACYLNVPLTTIRKQNYIAVGYFVATCLSLILGRYFVVTDGMLGAAFLYLCVNTMLVAVYAVVLALGVKI
jgi:O-antigen/teichoic acid export membrane protein